MLIKGGQHSRGVLIFSRLEGKGFCLKLAIGNGIYSRNAIVDH